MKRFIIKHRKGLAITAVILFLPILYCISISTIHFHNARYKNIYDELKAAARSNGLLVHHARRPGQPSNLFRFYDQSKPYRTSYGSDAKYVGYKNKLGEIVIPAIFKIGDSGFFEGLAWVVTEDNRHAFIHPDGAVAFTVRANYVDSFFNGRARIRFEPNPFKSLPSLLSGFVDKDGKVVVEMKYYGVNDFVGELDNEYTLVYDKTKYTSIYEGLMYGIDIEIPPFGFFFPPSKAMFLDKDGNIVPISEIRDSIKRLEEQAALKNIQ